MRLSRTDLGPVVAIIAGGAVGALLTFSPLLLSRSDDVPAPVPVVEPSAPTDDLVPTPTDEGVVDIAAAPVIRPITVRPELRNRNEIMRALMREYPSILRDAGVGGQANVWLLEALQAERAADPGGGRSASPGGTARDFGGGPGGNSGGPYVHADDRPTGTQEP